MEDENLGWAIAWRIVTLIWWGGWLLCAFGVAIGQAIAFNGGPGGIDGASPVARPKSVAQPNSGSSILSIKY
jgi:hypothetical protein